MTLAHLLVCALLCLNELVHDLVQYALDLGMQRALPEFTAMYNYHETD